MSLPAGIRIAWRAVPPGAPRRATSRGLLAELLPGASFVSRCPSCGGDHGRIRVEGVDAAVSVSYIPGWAVVAVTRDHARMGVDAVTADAGGLQRVLPGAADARAWARVEAVLKADGRGLRLDPGCVRVVAGGEGWTARIARPTGDTRTSFPPGEGTEFERAALGAALLRGGAGFDRTAPREWCGWDLDGPAGVVAALAVG